MKEEAELDKKVTKLRGQRDMLRDTLNATDEGQLYRHLKDENKAVVHKIGALAEAGKNVHEARGIRCRMVESWIATLSTWKF